MQFKDILKKLREEQNLKQKELSLKLNLSPSSISMYENGKRAPDIDTFELIADYFNVNLDYLKGRSDIKRPILNPKEENITEKLEDIPCTTLTYFDNVCVNCSSPLIPECSDIEIEEASISNNILGKYANNSNLVAIRSRGDSMDKIIPEGSIILIKKLLPFENVQNGDIVMYSFEDCWSIKEFIKKNDCVIFRPHSTNNSHKDNIYKFEDMENGMEVPKIIGKVVFYGVSL